VCAGVQDTVKGNLATMTSSTLAFSLGEYLGRALQSAGQPVATERDQLPGARINLLLKASHALLADCLGHVLEPHGLSLGAYLILLALHDRPDWVASPSSLAPLVAETRTNTTRICDRLTRKGLIRRHGNAVDRRRVDMTLTEAGEALIASLVPTIPEVIEEVYSIFTCEERASLECLLDRLSRKLTDTRLSAGSGWLSGE
jgi:DNA-binding MarR family transcriptional regulator